MPAGKHITLSSHQSMLRDVMLLTLDQKSASDLTHRTTFWKRFYEERDGSENEFAVFLASNQWDFLLVTGQVGAGKSTFILHKLEREGGVDAVYVNLAREARRLRVAVGEENAGSLLRNRLAELVAGQLRHRLMTYFIHIIAKRIPLEHEHFDFTHRLGVRINTLTAREEKPYFEAAQAQMLTEMLLAAEGQRYEMFIQELGDEARQDDGRALEVRLREELVRQPRLRDRLIKLADESDWLHAYASVFPQGTSLLVLDNLDALESQLLSSATYTYMLHLADSVNAGLSHGEERQEERSPPFKFVLACRDENMARLDLEGGASRKRAHIILGAPDGYTVASAKEWFLPLSQPLLRRIVENRITFARELLKPEWEAEHELFRKLTLTWFESDDRLATLIHCRELNNHSVRLCLEMIVQVAEYMKPVLTHHLATYPVEERAARIETLLEHKHFMRGYVIHWLVNQHSTTRSLVGKVKKELSQTLGGGPCDVHRLVLSFLTNRREITAGIARGVEYRAIADAVVTVGIDEDAVRLALYDLYASRIRQSEFISIYQREQISGPDAISRHCLIRLNPRGEVLLKRVLITFEFWRELVCEGTSPLFAQAPEEAVSCVGKVLLYVRKVGNAHRALWRERIAPAIAKRIREIASVENIYEAYARDFCIGDALHMERVISSHIATIERYAFTVLKGRQASLLLNGAAWSRFLDEYGGLDVTSMKAAAEISDSRGAEDGESRVAEGFVGMEALPEEAPKVLHQLWEIRRKYMEELRKYGRLKYSGAPSSGPSAPVI